MAPLLLLTGYGLVFAGGLMMLIAAFRESVLWGLACLLLPIVSIFFLIVHWSEARRAFVVQLLGVGFLVAGLILAAGNPHPFRIH